MTLSPAYSARPLDSIGEPHRGPFSAFREQSFDIDGAAIEPRDLPRFDTPNARSEPDGQETTVEAAGFGVGVNLEAGTRVLFAPQLASPRSC